MNDFPMIKANEKSIYMRKPLYGVGTNDSDYITQPTINGQKFRCKFYVAWANMLERCYSLEYQKKGRSYIDCTVCDEWLTFSNFRKWMELQAWEGMALDKDILVPGNKIYSPDKCCFVPSHINSLLSDSAASRGGYPIGVSIDGRNGRYRASCTEKNENVHLGVFDTPEAAHKAYLKKKSEIITAIAKDVTQDMSIYVRLALLKRAA